MRRRVRARRVLPGSREAAFSVLSDVVRFPDWWPGLTEARILVREGDVVVVEVRAPGYRAESIVLELVLSPSREIRFRQVGGYGRPAVTGRCELRDQGASTEIVGELRVETPLLRLGSGRHLRRGLEEVLAALAERTSATASGARANGGRRKILEIFERGDGLEIRLHGESFRLIRASEEETAP